MLHSNSVNNGLRDKSDFQTVPSSNLRISGGLSPQQSRLYAWAELYYYGKSDINTAFDSLIPCQGDSHTGQLAIVSVLRVEYARKKRMTPVLFVSSVGRVKGGSVICEEYRYA